MHLSLSADQVNCGLSRGKVKKQKKQNFSAPVKASFYSDVNNLQDLLAALSWKRDQQCLPSAVPQTLCFCQTTVVSTAVTFREQT